MPICFNCQVCESGTWQDSWRDLFKRSDRTLQYLGIKRGALLEASFTNGLANLVLEECHDLKRLQHDQNDVIAPELLGALRTKGVAVSLH